MKYTVLVFEDDMLVEECHDFMQHMETSMAFHGMPGYLGSITIPEDREVPSFEAARQSMIESNAMAEAYKEQIEKDPCWNCPKWEECDRTSCWEEDGGQDAYH